MDFGIAFALGLLGSLHCAAMCGPLLLALPVAAGGAGRFAAGRIIYQLGRVLTYALLGILAGVLGKSIFLAGLQRSLSVALGAAVLAGFFISKKVAVSAPAVRLVTTLKTLMAVQLQRRDFLSLLLLGMLNGLLPCGLVYAALANAATAKNISVAVAQMTVFGIGTLPMMLAVGLSGRMFPPALRMKLRALIPLGVCLLAALLVLRGLALGIPFVSPAASGPCCTP